MANPSVSIDIEPPSTVYTLPPPPKYSEVYQKSTPLPQLSSPSSNLMFPQRHGHLMGPSEIRPNLAASAVPPRNATTSNNSNYENSALYRYRRDIVMIRCCFSFPFLIVFIIFIILKIVNS